MLKLQIVGKLIALVFIAGCSTVTSKVDAQTEQLFSPAKPAFLDQKRSTTAKGIMLDREGAAHVTVENPDSGG